MVQDGAIVTMAV